MKMLLSISAAVFIGIGLLLLVLSRDAFDKINKITNRIVIAIDEKLHDRQKQLGILFLIVAACLAYIVLYKV